MHLCKLTDILGIAGLYTVITVTTVRQHWNAYPRVGERGNGRFANFLIETLVKTAAFYIYHNMSNSL